MNSHNKTLGPQGGRLILSLYERNHPIFTFDEAEEILGDRQITQNALSRLVERGIVTRLKAGLFRIVPFELGFEREYLGNPYIVAREIAEHNCSKRRQPKITYYISYGSAMDLHQMVTQPQLTVYTATLRQIRPRTILGTHFHFVRCKKSHFFGITDMWAEKNERVKISDVERTILDGLKHPEYCGGFTEVVKGLWIKRSEVVPSKLVDYALRLNIGVVIRRLGFLMELFNFDAHQEIEQLRKKLTATYHVLDPELPAQGKFLSSWKLRLNISKEELQTLGRT